MTDFFIKTVPLPVPHPKRINYNPLTETPDIWSHKLTVKDKILELLAGTNIYDFASKMEDWYFTVIAVASVGAILGLGYLLIAWIVRKVCGND